MWFEIPSFVQSCDHTNDDRAAPPPSSNRSSVPPVVLREKRDETNTQPNRQQTNERTKTQSSLLMYSISIRYRTRHCRQMCQPSSSSPLTTATAKSQRKTHRTKRLRWQPWLEYRPAHELPACGAPWSSSVIPDERTAPAVMPRTAASTSLLTVITAQYCLQLTVVQLFKRFRILCAR
jgi:hypothetical protein